MKPHLLVSLCLALLGSGCMLVPSPYSAQLTPVVELYTSIQSGASRAEIEGRLGKPTREEDGACIWETRFDEKNYAIAKVWFEGGDKAGKVEITKAHGKSARGVYASAVTTYAK